MHVHNYSEWEPTNIALHMLLQMMGKVKLDKMRPQPEWNHSLLHMTHNGFTTGLMPDGRHSFEVTIDVLGQQVNAHCTSGAHAGFALGNGLSVSDYYDKFHAMLRYVGHPCRVNPVPQEVFFKTPFDHQTDPVDFDAQSAKDYFETCVFARNALLHFSAPFRGKKIQPSLFWGTFDMTTVLFAGTEHVFPGEGIIEQVAFDEQFVEFGFWPGDRVTDEPMFFILPYPFVDHKLDDSAVSPKEAWFSEAKKEYFLKLEDVLRYDDPMATIERFCRDAFAVIAKETGWKNLEWMTKPLLI